MYHYTTVPLCVLLLLIRTYALICGPGNELNSLSSVCVPCNPGYSSLLGVVCAECEAGSFSSEEGSSVCSYCSPGYYQSTTGQSSCTPCATGTYQDKSGKQSCKYCASSMITGATTCPDTTLAPTEDTWGSSATPSPYSYTSSPSPYSWTSSPYSWTPSPSPYSWTPSPYSWTPSPSPYSWTSSPYSWTPSPSPYSWTPSPYSWTPSPSPYSWTSSPSPYSWTPSPSPYSWTPSPYSWTPSPSPYSWTPSPYKSYGGTMSPSPSWSSSPYSAASYTKCAPDYTSFIETESTTNITVDISADPTSSGYFDIYTSSGGYVMGGSEPGTCFLTIESSVKLVAVVSDYISAGLGSTGYFQILIGNNEIANFSGFGYAAKTEFYVNALSSADTFNTETFSDYYYWSTDEYTTMPYAYCSYSVHSGVNVSIRVESDITVATSNDYFSFDIIDSFGIYFMNGYGLELETFCLFNSSLSDTFTLVLRDSDPDSGALKSVSLSLDGVQIAFLEDFGSVATAEFSLESTEAVTKTGYTSNYQLGSSYCFGDTSSTSCTVSVSYGDVDDSDSVSWNIYSDSSNGSMAMYYSNGYGRLGETDCPVSSGDAYIAAIKCHSPSTMASKLGTASSSTNYTCTPVTFRIDSGDSEYSVTVEIDPKNTTGGEFSFSCDGPINEIIYSDDTSYSSSPSPSTRAPGMSTSPSPSYWKSKSPTLSSSTRSPDSSTISPSTGRYTASPVKSLESTPSPSMRYESPSSSTTESPVALGCVAGEYQDIATSKCVSCPVGWYSDSSEAAMCHPCPPGSYSKIVRSASCSLCAAGRYQPKAQQNTCLTCSTGESEGQDYCKPEAEMGLRRNIDSEDSDESTYSGTSIESSVFTTKSSMTWNAAIGHNETIMDMLFAYRVDSESDEASIDIGLQIVSIFEYVESNDEDGYQLEETITKRHSDLVWHGCSLDTYTFTEMTYELFYCQDKSRMFTLKMMAVSAEGDVNGTLRSSNSIDYSITVSDYSFQNPTSLLGIELKLETLTAGSFDAVHSWDNSLAVSSEDETIYAQLSWPFSIFCTNYPSNSQYDFWVPGYFTRNNFYTNVITETSELTLDSTAVTAYVSFAGQASSFEFSGSLMVLEGDGLSDESAEAISSASSKGAAIAFVIGVYSMVAFLI